MSTASIGVRNGNTILSYMAATKRTKELDISAAVTSTQAGWTTTRAVAIFYADSNGVWRLKFNLQGSFDAESISSLIVSITGITLVSAYSQAISGGIFPQSANGGVCHAFADNGGSSLKVYSIGTITNAVGAVFSGDIELGSEPTTYTTTANMEGVVAADVYIAPASASVDGLVNRSTQTFAGVKTFTNGISLGNQTLSVYDEGTWVPSVTDSAGVAAFLAWISAPTGKYTRIGNLVTAKLMFRTNGVINPACASSNPIRISVPFTASVASQVNLGVCQLYIASNAMDGKGQPQAIVSGGVNYITLEAGPLTGPANNKSPSDVTIAMIEGGNAAQISITITYFV
jgi:hypothetical protein